MHFAFLADHLDIIPIVARWYFDQWGCHVEGTTYHREVERLRGCLNRDELPFVRLAMDGETVFGVAQLKLYEMKELLPQKKHWIGGVFVAPEYRDQGVGSRLALEIVRLAPSLGVETLHLQTEQLDGGLYAKLGWRPAEQVLNGKVRVLVMEKRVSA